MEIDVFWNAVKANDSRFDGAFFLGVKTTGIYCKPSCRARLPKRENVEFYPSVDAAEEAGFRACLRCAPKVMAVDPQIAKIMRACELIENDDVYSLEDLALRERDRSLLPNSRREIWSISYKFRISQPSTLRMRNFFYILSVTESSNCSTD